MNLITALLSIIKILTLFDKWIPIVLKWFQKDPVKQIIEDQKEHDEATKKTEMVDNTSGNFGG